MNDLSHKMENLSPKKRKLLALALQTLYVKRENAREPCSGTGAGARRDWACLESRAAASPPSCR